MTATEIRAKAVLDVDGRIETPPGELVEAMIRFEERYGGLQYPLLGSNGIEYGLGGDATVRRTPLGLAFTGVLDGDWTWPLDVLADGRTTMGPGGWDYRVIDRSLDQRLESHALLLVVRGWFHRTFTCVIARDVFPVADERRLPQPVPEASGPAELWWLDETAGVAVQAQVRGWPGDRDEWRWRHFARSPRQAIEANPIMYGVTIHETVPALWCTLCSHVVEPGNTCHIYTGHR